MGEFLAGTGTGLFIAFIAWRVFEASKKDLPPAKNSGSGRDVEDK